MALSDIIENIKSIFGGTPYEANKSAIENLRQALEEQEKRMDRQEKRIDIQDKKLIKLEKIISRAIKVSYECNHVKDNGIAACPAWKELIEKKSTDESLHQESQESGY